MRRKLEREINVKLDRLYNKIIEKKFEIERLKKPLEIEKFTELIKEFFVPAIKELLRSEIDRIKNIEGKVELFGMEVEGLRKENQLIKAGIGRKIFDYLSKEK